MRFSEREGFRTRKQSIQTDSIDIDLRNSLWNTLDEKIWSQSNFIARSINSRYMDAGIIQSFGRTLWSQFFKIPADEREHDGRKILNSIREAFFEMPWFEVYDFVEFVVNYFASERELVTAINAVLERELAGFRIVGNLVAPVTSQTEVEAVGQALDSPFNGAKTHIERALGLLSSKPSPDYRNSIKESISAVESACKEITGEEKATLGSALKMLSQKIQIHPALIVAFDKLYGYTSSEGGIRHAIFEDSRVSADDAKFFLIACSAFVNLLKEKSSLSPRQ